MLKRGDIVYAIGRINRMAKDGSWVDIHFPTIGPNTNYHAPAEGGRRRTNNGKWWNGSEWVKTVRMDQVALFIEKQNSLPHDNEEPHQ